MISPNNLENYQGGEEEISEICPVCGCINNIFDQNRGELICGNCGIVIFDKGIDKGPEWRAFDSDQREHRTRVGAPMTMTLHDMGLSTIIDWKNKDFTGHEIPAKMRAQLYRLRRWQSRIRVSDATDRNLVIAFSELDRMASALGLSKNLRETAAKVYRNAVKSHLIRGRSIEGVVAASLYASCHLCKIPRTLQEIADVARVDQKEIGRSYRFIASRLNIASNPTKAVDYVARFISELNLTNSVAEKTMDIIKLAERKGLTSGRCPTGVAAAAIYLASVFFKERRTQREIARVSQVTEVTVRNRFKELITRLDLNMNEYTKHA